MGGWRSGWYCDSRHREMCVQECEQSCGGLKCVRLQPLRRLEKYPTEMMELARQMQVRDEHTATTLIALCHSPHCIVPLPSLYCAAPLTALCRSPHCIVPLPSLHCATPLTALCHSPHCIVPLPLLHCATPLTVLCHSPVLI